MIGNMSDAVKGKLKKYMDKKGMAMPEDMAAMDAPIVDAAPTDEGRKTHIEEMKKMMDQMGYDLEDFLRARLTMDNAD